MSLQEAGWSVESLPTSPVLLMEGLGALGISYQLFHHRAVFTVAESADLKKTIPGTHCRNLFIRDRKERMFLVTAANETKIDMKKLPALLGCDRLSFGSPERLWKHLGVRPGSVCPFAVINDKEKAVTIVLDAAMMRSPLVNYHPLENTMSLALTPDDLSAFIRSTGHEPWVLDLSPATPDNDKGEKTC